MAVRLTRVERQRETRAALVRAARGAFLEHGYEGASLAEIAEAAGCTTGAVYANFDGKDGLLLAVLDARLGPSLQEQADLFRGDAHLEDALRAVGRFLIDEYDEDPRWAALAAEYWARAARHEEFRRLVVGRHEAILERVSELIDDLARRHGRRLALPTLEVARGAAALARGVRMERALGLRMAYETAPEDLFVALLTGLMREEDR
jgi:AcrR family transcriptional regulator